MNRWALNLCISLYAWATWGTPGVADRGLALKVLHANVCAMVIVVTSLFFNLVYWFLGVPGLIHSGLAQLPFVLLTLLVFPLHTRGHYLLARVGELGVIGLLLCSTILAGQGTALSAHYYLLLMTVLALPMFRLSEWRWSGTVIVLSLSLFLFFEFHGWPPDPTLLAISEQWIAAMRFMVIGSCVTTAIILILLTESTTESYLRLLEALALTDVLTGLPNRRFCMQTLKLELAKAERDGSPLTIAMLDIDHFKRITDQEGHDVGDVALCHVARVVQQGLRATDFVARMGGEEFAIIMPQTSEHDAERLLDTLRQAVARSAFQATTRSRAVTISIGLTEGHAGATESKLLRLADTALYRAKAQGRDRVVRYSAAA